MLAVPQDDDDVSVDDGRGDGVVDASDVKLEGVSSSKKGARKLHRLTSLDRGYEDIPEWAQDNEFIARGYRECNQQDRFAMFYSIFQVQRV
jgi:hypothetical protein